MNDVQQAYREYRFELLLKRVRSGYMLLLLFVPSGILLDWFVYRDQWTALLGIRMVCWVILLGLLLLLKTGWARKNSRVMGLVWTVPMVGYVAWIMALTEGFESPYYIGIAIVILAGCLMLPWTLRECLVACGVTFSLYLLGGFLHGLENGLPQGMEAVGVSFLSFFFTVLFSIIAVVSSHLIERQRVHEFMLQFQLDQNKKKLEVSLEQLDRNKQELEKSYEQLDRHKQDLEASYTQLSELDRAKNRFFANISHELRTPLMLILAPLERLQATLGRGDADADPETLEIMQQNALRLLGLINDLLDLVRLEEGRLNLNMEPVDVTNLLRGLAGAVREAAHRKGLELVLDQPPDERPCYVLADKRQLEKVYLNLMFNALKFTDEGSVTLRARVKGAEVLTEIVDTGVGISEDKMSNVFDRFWQEEDSLTRQHQGAGIGLALAKELVDLHEGKVWVDSRKGEGTTFHVSLPITDQRPEEKPVEPKEEEEDWIREKYKEAHMSQARLATGPEKEEQTEPRRMDYRLYQLLIVEDEPDMRRFLSSELKGLYNLLVARDGREGLKLAVEHQPDLILTDLMMPEINGIELCRHLKAQPELLPSKIILLTARADEHTKIEALEAGADDFLPKPCGTTELKTRLANLVANARLERQLKTQNTELEDTLRRLRETETQLIQSERLSALGGLAAGIMHEINNPVNFMLTAVNYLKRSVKDLDEDSADTVNDIEEGLIRIRDIIADLKGFAYGKPTLEKSECDVERMWRTTKRLLANDLKLVTLEEDIDNESFVFGDQNQIVQLLTNLVKNSVQATEENQEQGKERCLSVTMAPGKDRFTMRVRDNGKGIDPKDQPHIFDPFFTTKEVGEGMGLGLAISFRIIQNHKADINVQSSPGEFTEFTISFPNYKAETEDLEPAPA